MSDLAQPLETRVATGRGRPTLYRPELCEQARRHLGSGATLAQFAGLMGVAPRSIDNWIARAPAFAAAVREGRAEAEAALERLLYQRAVGYSRTVERPVRCRGRVEIVQYTKYHAPDARACMRFLCRRAPQDWRRRPDLPSRRASDDRGVNRAHLFDPEVVEVVSSLQAIGKVYELPVERVVVWFGEPRVLRYTRQLRPHTSAGMFWLCNRLPEQWSYDPSLRRRLVPEDYTVNRAHKFQHAWDVALPADGVPAGERDRAPSSVTARRRDEAGITGGRDDSTVNRAQKFQYAWHVARPADSASARDGNRNLSHAAAWHDVEAGLSGTAVGGNVLAHRQVCPGVEPGLPMQVEGPVGWAMQKAKMVLPLADTGRKSPGNRGVGRRTRDGVALSFRHRQQAVTLGHDSVRSHHGG